MKKLVLLTLTIGISLLAFGNTDSPVKAPNSLPVFSAEVNGHNYNSIGEYMAKSVKLPNGTDGFGLIGTSVAQFVVTSTGTVVDINIINSVTYEIDQQVISALKKTSGKWNPGVKEGKPANMKREVAVVFKPNPNFDLVDIARKNNSKAEAKLLLEGDAKKAAKYYDKAIAVLPYELSFFAARGLCKYEMGDVEGAKKDWSRITYLNDYNPQEFNYRAVNINPAFKNLKGYTVLSGILK